MRYENTVSMMTLCMSQSATADWEIDLNSHTYPCLPIVLGTSWTVLGFCLVQIYHFWSVFFLSAPLVISTTSSFICVVVVAYWSFSCLLHNVYGARGRKTPIQIYRRCCIPALALSEHVKVWAGYSQDAARSIQLCSDTSWQSHTYKLPQMFMLTSLRHGSFA